jgi:hypothetical protein
MLAVCEQYARRMARASSPFPAEMDFYRIGNFVRARPPLGNLLRDIAPADFRGDRREFPVRLLMLTLNAFSLTGGWYRYLGRADSMEPLKKSIELQPDLAITRYWLRMAYADLGRHGECD